MEKTIPLSTKDPNEIYPLKADFSRDMAADESITVVYGVTCEVLSGTDPDAATMLAGSPVINGRMVQQAIRNGVAGVTYLIRVTVTTSTGNRYTAGGQLYVERAGL